MKNIESEWHTQRAKNWDFFSESVPNRIIIIIKRGHFSPSYYYSLVFCTKLRLNIISHINTFMTSEYCSTCNESGNTSYTCFTCHRFMCTPCIIAYVLSTSYPAKIIRNCPFCNTSLTTHEIKRLYLANLEYAGLRTNVTHQHNTTWYKRRKHNPYI